MGRLIQLEVSDFKSYAGTQVIGPFSSFTGLIGPNGAGKSNLMDAVSFVLGIQAAHLRSGQARDLIHRSPLHAAPDAPEPPSAAYVAAFYRTNDGRDLLFKRTYVSSVCTCLAHPSSSVSRNGTSEYRINNRVVSYARYAEVLQEQNILIKARNFLVFQGDVEAIASQSPRDLTRLIEQISG